MSNLEIPTATSSLQAWLSYLENLHTSAIDLGLTRIEKVAKAHHLTKPAPKVITVAGTNGKGSTCAIIEAILLDAGYKVGVYSSPHLIRYNERVRINGEQLGDAAHSEAFSAVEQFREETSLSYFEFGTLAAFYLFKKHPLDVVILEVGLGGRLDATNVAEHDVSVITSLAVDHVDWLGDDINVIGFEKAGIFRTDKPAVCGQPEPPSSVAAHADDIGAELHQLGYQYTYQVEGDRWHWQCGAFDLTDLPLPSLPVQNAATALMALGVAELDIADTNIVNGLKQAKLAGRMEQVSSSPTVILDVAHNPHSAQYLANILSAKKKGDCRIHAVVAMLHDKDIKSTLAEMLGVVDQWYAASLEGPRAATANVLAEHLPACQTYQTPVSAYQAALDASDGQTDTIVVFGSFFTVGLVSDYLANLE